MVDGPDAGLVGAATGPFPRWARLSLAGVTAVALLLFSWVSLGRTLWFSPDSFFYADVAMNLAEGRGLVQSILVTFVRSPGDGLYMPLQEWAPGYPLLIAVLYLLGIPPGYAALGISAFALLALVAAVWLMLRRMFDEGVAAVGVGLLLVYLPVIYVFRHAWSEGPSSALFFAGLALLCGRPASFRSVALSGLLMGAAFATRYAYLPALLVGPAILVAHWGTGVWRSRCDKAASTERIAKSRLFPLLFAWGVGSACVVVPLVAANLHRTGHWLGPPREPSTVSLTENLSDAWEVVTAGYLSRELLSAPVQAKSLLVFVLAVLLVAVLRRRVGPLLGELKRRRGWVLLLWAVVYLGFMVAVRSLVEIDRLGSRLLLPGLVPLVLLFGAYVVRGLGLRQMHAWALAMMLLAGSIAWQSMDLLTFPQASLNGRVAASDRLRWISEHTGPDDLIIGDSAFDVPLYCGPRHVWCYIPLADPAYHLNHEDVQTFIDAHRHDFRRAYIVLRKAAPVDAWAKAQWRQYYGEYFTELVYSGTGLALSDAFVFEL